MNSSFGVVGRTGATLPNEDGAGQDADEAGEAEDRCEAALPGEGGGEAFGDEHEARAEGGGGRAVYPVAGAGVGEGAADVSVVWNELELAMWEYGGVGRRWR